MVEGGMKCVKYVLFIFNLLFFLAGLGLIIAGALVQTKLSRYFDFFGGSVTALAVLLIVVGGIIFIIGFFGCCGAYKENYCMVMTFAFLLVVIFILEISAGIAAYVMRNEVEDLVTDKMTESLTKYEEQASIQQTWKALQHDMECCGVNNYTDWTDHTIPIPESCCKVETSGCVAGDPATTVFDEGCLDKFVNMVKDNIIIVGGVGIGLAFVQIVGIVLACCLARTIKKEYQVV